MDRCMCFYCGVLLFQSMKNDAQDTFAVELCKSCVHTILQIDKQIPNIPAR